MSEDTKPKVTTIKEPKIQPIDQTADIVSQTVAKTMEALLPYLQNEKKVEQPFPKNSNDVRSDIIRQINSDFDRALQSNKRFMAKLASAPQSEYIRVKIPRVYAQYFGSMLPVGVNGSIINIPIDNRYHRVHKVFGPIIQQTLEYEDEKISYMQRTGNTDIIEVRHENLGQ